jgi:hypothetical protein
MGPGRVGQSMRPLRGGAGNESLTLCLVRRHEPTGCRGVAWAHDGTADRRVSPDELPSSLDLQPGRAAAEKRAERHFFNALLSSRLRHNRTSITGHSPAQQDREAPSPRPCRCPTSSDVGGGADTAAPGQQGGPEVLRYHAESRSTFLRSYKLLEATLGRDAQAGRDDGDENQDCQDPAGDAALAEMVASPNEPNPGTTASPNEPSTMAAETTEVRAEAGSSVVESGLAVPREIGAVRASGPGGVPAPGGPGRFTIGRSG